MSGDFNPPPVDSSVHADYFRLLNILTVLHGKVRTHSLLLHRRADRRCIDGPQHPAIRTCVCVGVGGDELPSCFRGVALEGIPKVWL